jgi:hypothetical protein
MNGTRKSSLLGKITVLLIICCCCLTAQGKYGGGTGGLDDPYLIYDDNQMNAIGADSNDWDKHFKLMADIDLVGFTGTSFNIIGDYYYDAGWVINPFTGVFDGNGHTISNFTYTSTVTDCIGLFGYVDDPNAEIKNLGLIDPNIDAGTKDCIGSLVGALCSGTINGCYVEGGDVSGDVDIGGLVGYSSESTIINCCSTADVAGEERVGGLAGENYHGKIIDCCSTAGVAGYEYVGGLVGYNHGTISNCYAEGGSVGGYSDVGGLVGSGGNISNCRSSGSVSGDYYVGGLVGSGSKISNCYSTGTVLGKGYVGGLVGSGGRISNCRSSGSVSGDYYIGGLVGSGSKISNCYSAGNTTGNYNIGGLVGRNSGTVTDCYSTSSVSGKQYIGGIVGRNGGGKIANCYSTGRVMGYSFVGGLVGWNREGEVTNSFWDIETSGQTTSAAGTGLPTPEMQIQITFTDAGWDFVGETFNGIEDIWFIPEGDYPHLWWEGMQVPMKLTPRTLNCLSYGNWVTAHLTLPEGFTIADVDSNRPAVLHSFGFESASLHIFVNENELVEIKAAFEREAVCSLAGDWPEALTVAGFLTDGNIFLGTSTVRMIAPGMKVIEELAWYWLNEDCVHPTWCDGIDMNRDFIVNSLDYALLMNIKVEFVTDE